MSGIIWLELNGEVLDGVNVFNYLGTTLVANGEVELDISSRLREEWNFMSDMKAIVKNRGIGIVVKRELYERIIISAVEYEGDWKERGEWV